MSIFKRKREESLPQAIKDYLDDLEKNFETRPRTILDSSHNPTGVSEYRCRVGERFVFLSAYSCKDYRSFKINDSHVSQDELYGKMLFEKTLDRILREVYKSPLDILS